MKKVAILLLLLNLFSCTQKQKNIELTSGNWLFQLQISREDSELTIPFNVEVLNAHQLVIKNANERIEVNEITYNADSVFIKMPVFGSEFKGIITGNTISGKYFNYNKSKVSPILFTAKHGVKERFKNTSNPTTDFSGNWQVNFGSDENPSPAIGIFSQNGNMVTGTFQTEVGDYRYLQGVVNGNTMQLSCFDGAHAFLFTATQTNGKIDGMFYSGDTWKQNWTAEKTNNPELGDMKSLTFLKPRYEKFTFAFPNDKGQTISLADKRYKNKVVIVQIFGTWCPNCMDETRYLVELYKKYNSQGLEIIGLDFETKTDFDYFKKRITRFRKDLNVPYELVLAGPANKKLAAESLPMLNKVISYPTVIFIDKKGNVKEIHTGFSGPGTGEDYEHYKKETEELVEKLISE
jgi:thiol-disulfide isomerase/thioredoxin